jgi:hypothetical protein
MIQLCHSTENVSIKGPMWLLLIHQIPPDPSYLRVKVRRRLRRIGATALKSTVYVLPANDPAREHFEWLAREVCAGGGDAILCEARFIGGTSDEEVRDLFRGEREAEYAEIVRAMQEITLGNPDEGQVARIARARRRMAAVTELDFFDAPGRAAAERAIMDAQARLAGTAEPTPDAPAHTLEAIRGKTWVTRRGVHVDRMASAWLIRHFIDPDARFCFVDPDGYRPAPHEVRFDMYEAEFTHEGDHCTFEVLSAVAAPEDAALRAVAEIVHDIDLKDGKFGRPEAAGVERMITGIQEGTPSDDERLARGAVLFEGLYRAFGGTR